MLSGNIDSEEYRLIKDCNAFILDIENEIWIRDKYKSKSPELESLIPQYPIDYARAVKRIGNETDLSLVDLQELLPAATILVVSIMGASTSGKPLPEQVLQKIIEACDHVIALDSAKKKVINLLVSRMECIAPNLSAVVGGEVAAKLIGIAGGLSALAEMLANKNKLAAGFSKATFRFH